MTTSILELLIAAKNVACVAHGFNENFLPKVFLDMDFLNQHLFGPNIFLTKTTSMTTTTTTIKMGFDTIEINLVLQVFFKTFQNLRLTPKFGNIF